MPSRRDKKLVSRSSKAAYPFPVFRVSVGQNQPGNAKDRTFSPDGVDGLTGPSYSERRANTNVSGTTKPVRRYGVAAQNRGEWRR